jgi:hypothetical protein
MGPRSVTLSVRQLHGAWQRLPFSSFRSLLLDPDGRVERRDHDAALVESALGDLLTLLGQ